MIDRLRARWSILGIRGRVAVVIAVALIAVAFSVRPLARGFAPRIAVAAAAAHPGSGFVNTSAGRARGRFHALDPWGEELHGEGPVVPNLTKALRIYSAGPDRVDDGGQGDDVVPTPDELRLGRRVAGQPAGLLFLGLLILWATTSRGLHRPRARALKIEVVRALLNAFAPSFFLLGAASTVVGPDWTEWVNAVGTLAPSVVHPLVAILGADALLCFLVVLGWRLGRPLEGAEP